MSSRFLIINADDGGLSPEVDEGILETIHKGVVTSVSLLVNPPFYPDVDTFIRSGASMGLHLNLTLGRACAPVPVLPQGGPGSPLVDNNGYFHHSGYSDSLVFDPLSVKTEFLGQLDCFRRLTGADPTHLDVHKHLHRKSMEILSVVTGIAAELRIPVRCLDEAMGTQCRAAGVLVTDRFIGNVIPAPYWTLERLRTQLSGLPDGITELMCHPGRHMKPMEGLAYVEERDEERKILCSPEAKEMCTPFRLVNFRTAPFRRIHP